MIFSETPHRGWTGSRACVALALIAGTLTTSSALASKLSAVDGADVAVEQKASVPQPLIWSAYKQPKESAHDLIMALEASPEHGLTAERYAVDELYEALERASSGSDLRRFDDLFTAALWTYAKDMRDGHALLRNERQSSEIALTVPPDRDSDLYKQMLTALETDSISGFLDSLVPELKEYVALQGALEHYQELDLLGGWPKLPANTSLKPGDTDGSVLLMRQRLAVTDDNVDLRPLTDPEAYDAALVEAVKRFQVRHGMPDDGEVGPMTLAALNQTAAEKVTRIAYNLNRMRQLPDAMPDDYIFVNIPQFELEMFRDSSEALRMPVVVGSKRNPTPPMIDKIRHLVFNPYWYPPRGISVGELLPRLKRDPGYLKRQDFDVLRGKKVVDSSNINWRDYTARNFPYRFRQRPGKKNSLGRVKFIFPNAHAVYLHDTPQKKLFAEHQRARSHGCVRVGRPLELARAVMEWDRGWGDADVEQELKRKKRKLRKLNERMDVFLMYLTARVDDGGEVRFWPDVYRHDISAPKWEQPAPAVARHLSPDVPVRNAVAARR